MEAVPKNLENIGTTMSNFDHKIDHGTEDRLKAGGTYCGYAAWDFFAFVWWDDPKFKAMIKQYQVHIDTIEADTLQEIMNIASRRYGFD